MTSTLPAMPKILGLLAIATLSGFLFDWLQVPVGWLLGPLLVGMLYSLHWGHDHAIAPGFTVTGQAIIALATATHVSWQTLTLAATYAGPLLLCVLITGGLSLSNGYLLSRWTGLDRTTAFLGCLPGAGPSIVALSETMGADAIAVAMLQYLRILMVTSIVPAIAGLLLPPNLVVSTQVTPAAPIQSTLPIPLLLLLLVGLGWLGIWAGNRFRLPAALFLGPFLVGLVASCLSPWPLAVPQPVFLAGLLLAGLAIGLKFSWRSFRALFKAAVIEVGLVLVLIGTSFAVGYGFHVVTHVDALTAVLGTSPGGLSAMMASVMQLGGDAGLVLAMQMSRMLLILLLSPLLAAVLARTASPQPPRSAEPNSQRPFNNSPKTML